MKQNIIKWGRKQNIREGEKDVIKVTNLKFKVGPQNTLIPWLKLWSLVSSMIQVWQWLYFYCCFTLSIHIFLPLDNKRVFMRKNKLKSKCHNLVCTYSFEKIFILLNYLAYLWYNNCIKFFLNTEKNCPSLKNECQYMQKKQKTLQTTGYMSLP